MYTEKFNECLLMQDKFNSIVNPEWKTAGYPFRRAAWIETAELIDHLGYKWWKHTVPNEKQVLLEVVDIFHFVLSDCILDNIDGVALSGYALQTCSFNTNEYGIKQCEYFVKTCIDDEIPMFVRSVAYFNMVHSLGIDIADVLKYYFGKSALNIFRQEHGYKDGSYRKMWKMDTDMEEDNVVLEHILETTDLMSVEDIKDELLKYY